MNNLPKQNSLLFASFECYEYNTDLPVFPVALHWHYYGEILRVRSGALKIQRGDQTYILSAGDAVFMNPLVPHAVDFAEPGMAAEYVVIRADLEQFSEYFSYTPDLRGMLLEAEKHRLPMVFTARELHDRNMDMMIDQCVLEYKARQYDHEVKGLSVQKPYVGKARDVANDASVFMIEPLSREGVVLAAGILPRYSDIDTYHMMASVIDLAIRRIVAEPLVTHHIYAGSEEETTQRVRDLLG